MTSLVSLLQMLLLDDDGDRVLPRCFWGKGARSLGNAGTLTGQAGSSGGTKLAKSEDKLLRGENSASTRMVFGINV